MRSLVVLALFASASALYLPDKGEQRYKRDNEPKIGGQAGIRRDPVQPTPVDVKPWKKSEPNLREIKEERKIGGQAGINPAIREKRDIDVANDKIGGQAGIRHDPAQPTPFNVKPWKEAEPDFRKLRQQQRDAGSATAEPKIGGQAGINPAIREKREFDVTKDKIGGKAGIRPRDEPKNEKIGGQAGINPAIREKRDFDVAKDKIGGQAGIRPDSQPTVDVKPWKKNEPRVGGKVN